MSDPQPVVPATTLAPVETGDVAYESPPPLNTVKEDTETDDVQPQQQQAQQEQVPDESRPTYDDAGVKLAATITGLFAPLYSGGRSNTMSELQTRLDKEAHKNDTPEQAAAAAAVANKQQQHHGFSTGGFLSSLTSRFAPDAPQELPVPYRPASPEKAPALPPRHTQAAQATGAEAIAPVPSLATAAIATPQVAAVAADSSVTATADQATGPVTPTPPVSAPTEASYTASGPPIGQTSAFKEAPPLPAKDALPEAPQEEAGPPAYGGADKAAESENQVSENQAPENQVPVVPVVPEASPSAVAATPVTAAPAAPVGEPLTADPIAAAPSTDAADSSALPASAGVSSAPAPVRADSYVADLADTDVAPHIDVDLGGEFDMDLSATDATKTA